MARRDLGRHRLRTALIAALVALPVVVGVAAAELSHNTRWEGERMARTTMGAADAVVDVTRFTRTRVTYLPGDMSPGPGAFTRDRSGRRTPVRRARSEVDLMALLPRGSRVTPAPRSSDVQLAGGGVAQVQVLDLQDPMTAGLASLASGAAPRSADQVALNAPAAAELGLLRDGGTLRSDATLRLSDGRRLRVVGVLAEDRDAGYDSRVVALAPPTSPLQPAGPPTRYLVDLPASAGPAPHAVAAHLARHGVAMLPRDIVFHPQAWHVQEPTPSAVDATAVAIGALAVLFGLVEVVLVVGSAFAVGARRQVRDLGLLAASGGAPADVRRLLLAQGLVLGLGASVVGAVLGMGAFLAAVPWYARVAHVTIWTQEVDWLAVGAVTVLGSVTGIAAALVPAWSVGRLTPVAALSGRFPVRAGESRAHRPAFGLAGAGIVTLALGGWWTAREYAPTPETEMFAHQPSSLPVVLGGLGLLMLVGGVVWSAPYVVRRVAGVGGLLPLSGRFAFRDAARHRFRTAAAAVALTVTAAGALFAGFVVQAVGATAVSDSSLPPHSLMVYLDDVGSVSATPDRIDRLLATVARVVGPVTARTDYPVTRRSGEATLGIVTGVDGSQPVSAVDEDTLRYLAGPDSADALRVFRAGGLVTTARTAVHRGAVTTALSPGARNPRNRFTLAAVAVAPNAHNSQGSLSTAWVSWATVSRLGLTSRPSEILVLARRQVTSEDVTRLTVHGINAWSPDADLAALGWVRRGVLAVAALLTLLVVGIAVALSAAEGRADLATMASVGAGPWRRRSLGAMHGLFLGLVGGLLGVVIGLPAGASLLQVDGQPGVHVPWSSVAAVLVAVPLLGWCAGWLTTSTRLPLVRRSG